MPDPTIEPEANRMVLKRLVMRNLPDGRRRCVVCPYHRGENTHGRHSFHGNQKPRYKDKR